MNVLYLSYTGLLEPLGQSQILTYLEKLAKRHSISLITFEKPSDLQNKEEFKLFKKRCENFGIHWVPLTYHKKPRLLATLYDIARFFLKSFIIINREKIDVVHCRGYIPTFVASIIKKLKQIPYIFDMRAFWPDEMVTAGRLEEDSIVYKVLKKLETRCLQEADHVVTLTKAAEDYLSNQYNSCNMVGKVTTIPTCVNLELFSMNGQMKEKKQKDEVILGSVGTVDGWFKIDCLFDFYKALQSKLHNVSIRFVSQTSPHFIKNKAEENGVNPSVLEIESCSYQEVPEKMRKMTAGAFFFEPGFSKLGSAPTRMGEFLACGIPCVANSGVGDVARILRKYEVGIVIDTFEEPALDKAVQELIDLLKDKELPLQIK